MASFIEVGFLSSWFNNRTQVRKLADIYQKEGLIETAGTVTAIDYDVEGRILVNIIGW